MAEKLKSHNRGGSCSDSQWIGKEGLAVSSGSRKGISCKWVFVIKPADPSRAVVLKMLDADDRAESDVKKQLGQTACTLLVDITLTPTAGAGAAKS